MHPSLRIAGIMTVAGLVLVLAAKYILPLLAPFVFGLFLACLIEPAVSWCEKKCHCPRWLASGGFLTLSVLLLGAGACWLTARIWINLRELALGEQGRQMTALLDRLAQSGTTAVNALPEPIRGILLQAARELPLRASALAQRSLGGLSRLPEWMALILLGLLAAHFFCRDWDRIARFIVSMTPREWRARAAGMRAELVRALAGFVRAQMFLSAITACLGVIGLSILGMPQAWLLGCLLGFLDLVPTIGPGGLLLPWAGVLFVLNDWARGLGLAAVFMVLTVARETIQARIFGGNLGLHPLAVLAGAYLGLKLLGFGGVFIGPIILVMLRAFHTALVLPTRGVRDRPPGASLCSTAGGADLG